MSRIDKWTILILGTFIGYLIWHFIIAYGKGYRF